MTDLYPLAVVVQMLAIARDGLADNTYFKGTFNVTHRALVRYEGSADGCQVRDLVSSIFGVYEEFICHLRASGDGKRQINQIIVELEELLQIPCSSSEIGGHWARILSSAKHVRNIVNNSFPHHVSDVPSGGDVAGVQNAAATMA
jgi:hypothetical protein